MATLDAEILFDAEIADFIQTLAVRGEVARYQNQQADRLPDNGAALEREREALDYLQSQILGDAPFKQRFKPYLQVRS